MQSKKSKKILNKQQENYEISLNNLVHQKQQQQQQQQTLHFFDQPAEPVDSTTTKNNTDFPSSNQHSTSKRQQPLMLQSSNRFGNTLQSHQSFHTAQIESNPHDENYFCKDTTTKKQTTSTYQMQDSNVNDDDEIQYQEQSTIMADNYDQTWTRPCDSSAPYMMECYSQFEDTTTHEQQQQQQHLAKLHQLKTQNKQQQSLLQQQQQFSSLQNQQSQSQSQQQSIVSSVCSSSSSSRSKQYHQQQQQQSHQHFRQQDENENSINLPQFNNYTTASQQSSNSKPERVAFADITSKSLHNPPPQPQPTPSHLNNDPLPQTFDLLRPDAADFDDVQEADDFLGDAQSNYLKEQSYQQQQQQFQHCDSNQSASPFLGWSIPTDNLLCVRASTKHSQQRQQYLLENSMQQLLPVPEEESNAPETDMQQLLAAFDAKETEEFQLIQQQQALQLQQPFNFTESDKKILEERAPEYLIDAKILLNYHSTFTNFPKKRAILLDWMQEFSSSLGLKRETYQQSISITDRYFARVPLVPKSQLQLVGATALLIAHKIEEVIFWKLQDFIMACNYGYTNQQFLDMETAICTTLNFSLSGTPVYFWMNSLMLEWDRFCEPFEQLFENDSIYFKRNTEESFRLFASVSQYLDCVSYEIKAYHFPMKVLVVCFMYWTLYHSVDVRNYPVRLSYFEQIFEKFLEQALQIASLKDLLVPLQFTYPYMQLAINLSLPQTLRNPDGEPQFYSYENMCSQQTYNADSKRIFRL